MSIAVGKTTAQTPLQGNFGTLKRHVAAFVQGASIESILADAGDAINAAVDAINERNWHFLNRQTNLTLTADTRTIELPSNFKRPRKLEKLDASGNTVDHYDYQTPKSFQDTGWDDTNSGQPTIYTVRNAPDDLLLTFNVAPTSDFVTSWPTARLTYYSRMGHFSDDGDTISDLGAPPEVRNFLLWYARHELATMRGARDQIRSAERNMDRHWFSLMKDDNNQQTDWVSWSDYR